MRLAASFGTGARTIYRDGKLAEAVEKLDPTVAKAVVNEDVKASRAAVAQLSRKSPAEQKEIVAKVQSGEAKTVQEAMKELDRPPEPEDLWLEALQEPYLLAIQAIQSASRHVKAVADLEKDGAHLAHLGTWSHIKGNLGEAVTHIKANKPAAGCPKCADYETRGDGCKACYGCGFISAVVHQGLTAKV